MIKQTVEFAYRASRKVYSILEQVHESFDADTLRIEYQAIDQLPEEPKQNCCGTHLNESGDTRKNDEYANSFSLKSELENPIVKENLLFIQNEICPLVAADAQVLDVGCGSGRYGVVLNHEKLTSQWRYMGVERSEEIVEYCRAFYPEGEFVSSDNSAKLPLTDASHDLVIASGMLHYRYEDWREALAEMVRVSRKLVFISRFPILLNGDSCYCHQTVWHGTETQHHYFKLLSRAEFESAVAELGCEIVIRDYSSEIFDVRGIEEPVVLNKYLILKKD